MILSVAGSSVTFPAQYCHLNLKNPHLINPLWSLHTKQKWKPGMPGRNFWCTSVLLGQVNDLKTVIQVHFLSQEAASHRALSDTPLLPSCFLRSSPKHLKPDPIPGGGVRTAVSSAHVNRTPRVAQRSAGWPSSASSSTNVRESSQTQWSPLECQNY